MHLNRLHAVIARQIYLFYYNDSKILIIMQVVVYVINVINSLNVNFDMF